MLIPKAETISRRTMLKGAGALLALPLLEAMSPRAHAESVRPPVRMAALYFPNGVNVNEWNVKGTGKDFELSPSLKPLADFKNDILVFTELMNIKTDTGDGHYVKTGGFLTGTTITRTTGSDLRSNGTSMDQVAARRIGNLTPLPSLELGIEPMSTGVDVVVGYTRMYGAHISWSTPSTPLAKEIDPRQAFNRLFRPKTAKATDATADKSVLDLVSEDANSLRGKVGAADQRKLDEYLASVRAIEKRIEFDAKRRKHDVKDDPLARAAIEKLGERIKTYYSDPARVSERRGDHTEQVRIMLDLMVLAYWTDSTRVSTFMFGNDVSNKNFSFVEGVKGAHHEMSHHENKPEKLASYALINRWHVQQLAYMLEKMKSIKEGDSNLLENSMILMGSPIRDGNSHNPHNMPLILAGQGGGTLKTGRHLVYPKNTPACNLYKSMLGRMGTPVEKFGDSTGELAGINDESYVAPKA
jgi:hypothetical protein